MKAEINTKWPDNLFTARKWALRRWKRYSTTNDRWVQPCVVKGICHKVLQPWDLGSRRQCEVWKQVGNKTSCVFDTPGLEGVRK